MIRSRRNIPAVAVLIAFIPGLAVWLFEQRRQAIVIVIILLAAVVLFITFPSLPAWCLASVIYIGQMVYSAGLSVWQTPNNEKPKVNLNARLAVPLPDSLRQARQLDRAINKVLRMVIQSDYDLISTIMGLDSGTSQYKFIGVNESSLIMADCTSAGNPVNISRLPSSEIAWVELSIGQRNCLMTIQFEEEHYPSLNLIIPGKLKEPAIKFLKEFPGNWGADPSSNRMYLMDQSFSEKIEAILTLLISSGFIFLAFFLRGPEPLITVLKMLSIVFGIYFFWWPTVIRLLQEIKTNPALTAGRILNLIVTVPLILFSWGIGVLLLGMEMIIALNEIR